MSFAGRRVSSGPRLGSGCPPRCSSTAMEIVFKREATKSSADNTAYEDWIRNWELRMKARGPR